MPAKAAELRIKNNDIMEMNKSVTPQTIVASSVFIDIVGFSKLSTSAQVPAKDRFNAALRLGLAELGETNYWVRDMGDGALLICPNSPEHALFVALKVRQDFMSFELQPGQAALEIRTGLNLGVLKTNPDLEGRANYLGDGINATQRVMDFAQPGQILASRAFVEALAFLHADYATMFLSPHSRQDKHGRTHVVYTVHPSPEALERLREEVRGMELPLTRFGVAHHQPTSAIAPITSPPHAHLLEHTISIIRNWFIPFNALLVTAGILWAGFQSFGLSTEYAQFFGLLLIVIGSTLWLIFRRRVAVAKTGAAPASSSRTIAAIGLLLGAVGGIVGATALIAHYSVKLATSSAAQNKPALAKEVADNSTSTMTSVLVPAVAVVPSTTALPAADRVKPKTNATAELTPVARKTALNTTEATPAPAAATDAERKRCAALLNKSALGERVSITEKQEIMQSCR